MAVPPAPGWVGPGDVERAVCLMYGLPLPAASTLPAAGATGPRTQSEAVQWLNGFADTPPAWDALHDLLLGSRLAEVRFYAANGLLAKVRREWVAMPPEQQAGRLSKLMALTAALPGLDLVTLRRLALALCVAAVAPGEPLAVQQLLDGLLASGRAVAEGLAAGSGGGLQGAVMLHVEVLRGLPEEIDAAVVSRAKAAAMKAVVASRCLACLQLLQAIATAPASPLQLGGLLARTAAARASDPRVSPSEVGECCSCWASLAVAAEGLLGVAGDDLRRVARSAGVAALAGAPSLAALVCEALSGLVTALLEGALHPASPDALRQACSGAVRAVLAAGYRASSPGTVAASGAAVIDVDDEQATGFAAGATAESRRHLWALSFLLTRLVVGGEALLAAAGAGTLVPPPSPASSSSSSSSNSSSTGLAVTSDALLYALEPVCAVSAEAVEWFVSPGGAGWPLVGAPPPAGGWGPDETAVSSALLAWDAGSGLPPQLTAALGPSLPSLAGAGLGAAVLGGLVLRYASTPASPPAVFAALELLSHVQYVPMDARHPLFRGPLFVALARGLRGLSQLPGTLAPTTAAAFRAPDAPLRDSLPDCATCLGPRFLGALLEDVWGGSSTSSSSSVLSLVTPPQRLLRLESAVWALLVTSDMLLEALEEEGEAEAAGEPMRPISGSTPLAESPLPEAVLGLVWLLVTSLPIPGSTTVQTDEATATALIALRLTTCKLLGSLAPWLMSLCGGARAGDPASASLKAADFKGVGMSLTDAGVSTSSSVPPPTGAVVLVRPSAFLSSVLTFLSGCISGGAAAAAHPAFAGSSVTARTAKLPGPWGESRVDILAASSVRLGAQGSSPKSVAASCGRSRGGFGGEDDEDDEDGDECSSEGSSNDDEAGGSNGNDPSALVAGQWEDDGKGGSSVAATALAAVTSLCAAGREFFASQAGAYTSLLSLLAATDAERCLPEGGAGGAFWGRSPRRHLSPDADVALPRVPCLVPTSLRLKAFVALASVAVRDGGDVAPRVTALTALVAPTVDTLKAALAPLAPPSAATPPAPPPGLLRDGALEPIYETRLARLLAPLVALVKEVPLIHTLREGGRWALEPLVTPVWAALTSLLPVVHASPCIVGLACAFFEGVLRASPEAALGRIPGLLELAVGLYQRHGYPEAVVLCRAAVEAVALLSGDPASAATNPQIAAFTTQLMDALWSAAAARATAAAASSSSAAGVDDEALLEGLSQLFRLTPTVLQLYPPAVVRGGVLGAVLALVQLVVAARQRDHAKAATELLRVMLTSPAASASPALAAELASAFSAAGKPLLDALVAALTAPHASAVLGPVSDALTLLLTVFGEPAGAAMGASLAAAAAAAASSSGAASASAALATGLEALSPGDCTTLAAAALSLAREAASLPGAQRRLRLLYTDLGGLAQRRVTKDALGSFGVAC